MAGSDDETTPQGWYRQKDDPSILRWWDGDGWTDETMPVPDEATSAAPAPLTSAGPAATLAGRVTAAPTGLDLGGVGEPNRTRPTIRIGDDEGEAPVRRSQALQAPDRPRRPRPPAAGTRSRSNASGRATGSGRPAPPPGDDRPRTDNWPQDRVRPATGGPGTAARPRRTARPSRDDRRQPPAGRPRRA